MGDDSISQRFLSEDDRAAARSMFGFAFWFGPALFSAILIVVLALTALRVIDPVLGLILLILFGIVSYFALSRRVRTYQAYRQDLEIGVARILEGSPEKVWMGGSGFCFIAIGGVELRIPNDQFQEAKDANSVKAAFLPTSGIVVELEVARGIGLSLRGGQ